MERIVSKRMKRIVSKLVMLDAVNLVVIVIVVVLLMAQLTGCALGGAIASNLVCRAHNPSMNGTVGICLESNPTYQKQ